MFPPIDLFWPVDPLPLTLAPMYSRDWWRFVSDENLKARGLR
jgi:hypothetical protein